jgi:hypothetical protein
LLALQKRILLRQGVPKIILEGTPPGLRAGLADAGLLGPSHAQLLQPHQSYQRLISCPYIPNENLEFFHVLLYRAKKRSEDAEKPTEENDEG